MFTDLNQRLSEIKDARRQQRKLQNDLLQAQSSLGQERLRLVELEKQLRKEGRDVQQLEGLSLAGLFYTILGSKEEQLDKERQEYLAARLKHTQAEYAVQSLEREVSDLQRQLARLGDVDSQYQAVMASKETLVQKSQDASSRRLAEISDSLADATAEVREISEALAAGSAAQRGLQQVIDDLKSASNWGVADFLGGGLLVDMAKHSRIDDARDAAQHAQQLLVRFQRELSDVYGPGNQGMIEVGDHDRFVEFFFDGLITDWIVQSKIDRSLDNAENMYQKVSQVLLALSTRQAAVQSRANSLQAEKQDLLENLS